MARSKKRHEVHFCSQCDEMFITVGKKFHKPHCCYCGDDIMVEKVKDIWMLKPFIHHTKYTQEEDDIIIESRRRGILVSDIEIDGRTVSSIESRWYRLRKKGVSL